ncbi:MAG: YihY/virulence factor BrkB family protein [Crocinitomicaceae bacterium]|nr:YihY/virulence factor BrkB family protein [Crocinitomicaceae bacterium]
MNKLKDTYQLLRTVLIEFFREKSMMHGASLAYYSILALVPLLYLSITIFGRIVGHDVMIDIIANLLREQIGIEDVQGVLGFLNQIDLGKGNLLLEIIGAVALMFSCTAILTSLKRSIDEFYDLDTAILSRRRKIVRGLLFRFTSMAFIAGITVVVILLYFAETIFLSISSQFFDDIEVLNWLFSGIVRYGLPIFMNALIFTFVFKYLHDGVVRWKMAMQGAFLTSILLYVGQLLIKFYLGNYFFAANGGVAGTLLIVLVWVYYSSQIIFLGAKYVAVQSKAMGTPIILRD